MCPCYPNSPKYQLPGCLLFQFLFVSYSDSSKYQLPRPLFLTSSNLCDICDSSFFQLLRFLRIPVTRALSYCFLSCTLWWVELHSDEIPESFSYFFSRELPKFPKIQITRTQKNNNITQVTQITSYHTIFFYKMLWHISIWAIWAKKLP